MRNTVFKLFAATIVTGVLAHPVIAQELKPLEQLMKRPSDQFEPSYPFVRCAAYYKGTAEYMGAARLSSQHIENIQKSVTMNAFAAVKIRASKRGGNPNDYVDQVTDDVNRIVAVYQDRMRKNYAASGQAFVEDSLITGDAKICKVLTESIAGK